MTETGSGRRGRVLLLSSSPLIDRVFLYTNLVSQLAGETDVTIWATSAKSVEYEEMWKRLPAAVEVFPEILPFREFPYNYLRRMNEFAWDFRFKIPSRESMRRHVRNKRQALRVRALKLPARLLSSLQMEQSFENRLERMLLSYPRSPEAERRLRALEPSTILSTGPFQFEQPAVFAAAKRLGIPTLAYIPSWDNVTTKNRMVFDYDGYVVWSKQTKDELHKFYPLSKNKPAYVIGAPQFDVFFQNKFYQTREEFCRRQRLDPALPIIVYAIGSPNFLQEHHGALHLAGRVSRSELGPVQMLVRPHPMHDRGELKDIFEKYAPRVRLQQSADTDKTINERTQDRVQIVEWINSFRHAAVVVNLSSTVTVDAAIFDKPIVNLDFDPQPGQSDQKLVEDINHKWNHFQPIAESGGVWLVRDFDEMVGAIGAYLEKPDLHRNERQWIARYVCGHLDGCCGERMAEAIGDFAGRSKNQSLPENIMAAARISRLGTHAG